MKKENVSYSVMYIKKGLRMIRLSNLHYEKTMQIAAQQTRVLLCLCKLIGESDGDPARYVVPKSTQSNVTY